MSKKIAVICPTHRDRRELSMEHVAQDHQLVFHQMDPDLLDRVISQGLPLPEELSPESLHHSLMELCTKEQIDGVIATDDYPASLFASHIACQLGLPAPRVESLLQCQHKYHARMAQQQAIPQASVGYRLLDPATQHAYQFNDVAFPLFVKPVKSYFSLYAQTVANREQLSAVIQQKIPFSFDHFTWLARAYGFEHAPLHHFLAEDHLYGEQCTLQGHVYHGQVTIHGIVDSVMFPGSLSFKEFTYPSKLPNDVQRSMYEYATTIMQYMGFDNGLFNIEFMYDASLERIAIIEINPRMASQFADIFEKVDGVNSYSVLLSLATGQKPAYTHGQGDFSCASSYVLRTFENQHIHAMPTVSDVKGILTDMPDVRIELFGQAGKTLAHELQDGSSYRYGLINAGASTRHELEEKIEACKKRLPFTFKPVFH